MAPRPPKPEEEVYQHLQGSAAAHGYIAALQHLVTLERDMVGRSPSQYLPPVRRIFALMRDDATPRLIQVPQDKETWQAAHRSYAVAEAELLTAIKREFGNRLDRDIKIAKENATIQMNKFKAPENTEEMHKERLDKYLKEEEFDVIESYKASFQRKALEPLLKQEKEWAEMVTRKDTPLGKRYNALRAEVAPLVELQDRWREVDEDNLKPAEKKVLDETNKKIAAWFDRRRAWEKEAGAYLRKEGKLTRNQAESVLEAIDNTFGNRLFHPFKSPALVPDTPLEGPIHGNPALKAALAQVSDVAHNPATPEGYKPPNVNAAAVARAGNPKRIV